MDRDEMSEQNAIDILNQLANMATLTPSGTLRIANNDSRVRALGGSSKGFPDKCRNFRLGTPVLAAHAEDCYCMWSIWNEGKEVKDYLKHFRYDPSFYLNDQSLKADLLKIQTADEMENYLKARYGTKKRKSPKRKRTVPNAPKADQAGPSNPQPHPESESESSDGDPGESEARPPEDPQAHPPSETTNITMSNLSGSIPITVDNCPVEVKGIIQKMTVEQPSSVEVLTLLQHAAQFPCSTVAPGLAPMGSIYVYNKINTPHYRKDAHGFGAKESHSRLVVNRVPCIKKYNAVNKVGEITIQRHCYFLIDDPTFVLVHYYRGDTRASTSTAGNQQQPSEPAAQTSKRQKKQSTGKCDFRALVAIGARVQIQISELAFDVFCDAVNDVCGNPPPGCEEAASTEDVNYKTLAQVTHDVLGVKFDDITPDKMEDWLVKVGDHPSSATITKLCSLIVHRVKRSLVTEDVKAAFEKASSEKTPLAMVLALGKLRKVPDIPEEELRVLINDIMKTPAGQNEELYMRFELIRDAIMDNDIQFAKMWIKNQVI
jgi:hypothetical protein